MARTDNESTVDEEPGTGHSKGWLVASVVVGALLVIWFLFAWLGLERNAVDAAGESVGTGLAILVVAAVIGAIRRSND
jgi:hypothetical protein